MTPLYLDYAASSPADERVIEAVAQCMREISSNPSAAYSAAGAARREMRLARQTIGRMLHADANAIYFTSGGTESNNWAMLAAGGGGIAVSAIEHDSVRNAAPGAVRIPCDADGVVSPEAVERAIRPDTALVSVQWANNETGALQPIEEISRIVHARGALLHVDAVQAFGHVPVDARLCDLMSLSAHKLYGPRGIGCLYVKPGVKLPPLLRGGAQESGRRAGTENVPAICGFRVAVELAEADEKERALQERTLMDAFVQSIDVPGLRLLSQNAERLPGIAALYLPGLSSEQAIADLDLMGIEVSGGAACHSRSQEPSHVFRAMGLGEKEAACVIRVSIGRGVAADDLARAAEAIAQVWRRRSVQR